MTLLAFLDELADAATKAILPHFRKSISVENKLSDGFDPVTAADKAGEAALRELITQKYPDHGILGEEYGNTNLDAEHVWVLDPIDGTRTFISGVPVWGTLIGHKKSGKAEIGMMCQPFTRERFSGDGSNAWYQRTDDLKKEALAQNEKTTLKTRRCSSLSQATLFTTAPNMFSHSEIEAYRNIESQVQLTRYGIDCYAYCMVASGHVDLVIESGLNAYDIAALIPIIEGAGGMVTTWDGGNAIDGGSIVASGDPSLHEAVLKLLNER